MQLVTPVRQPFNMVDLICIDNPQRGLHRHSKRLLVRPHFVPYDSDMRRPLIQPVQQRLRLRIVQYSWLDPVNVGDTIDLIYGTLDEIQAATADQRCGKT